ncbi:MAG: hypothetical protein IJX44_03420 [Bacteroidaceae bacterium]|nr:hypothetical protein [Bacteroidaceae bacterium]
MKTMFFTKFKELGSGLRVEMQKSCSFTVFNPMIIITFAPNSFRGWFFLSRQEKNLPHRAEKK